jgi:hypothetical protein
MLVQPLALHQRPLLKLGAIVQEEVLQELTAIELDQFFQPRSPDRRIFDVSAPDLFARVLKNENKPLSRPKPIGTDAIPDDAVTAP